MRALLGKANLVNTPDNTNFRTNPYSYSTNVYQSFLTKDGDIDYSKVVAVKEE